MKTPDAWISHGTIFVNRRKHKSTMFAWDGDRHSQPIWFSEFEPPDESESPTFEEDLRHILNKHGIDARLNTPDDKLSKEVMKFLDSLANPKTRGEEGNSSVLRRDR